MKVNVYVQIPGEDLQYRLGKVDPLFFRDLITSIETWGIRGRRLTSVSGAYELNADGAIFLITGEAA